MISPNELYERLRGVYENTDCSSQDCAGCKFYGGYKPASGVKCNRSAIEYALKIND